MITRGIPIFTVSEQCDCKKGYRSSLDGLCQHCRTKDQITLRDNFWKEMEEKDISQNSWEFKYLRKKHFGGIYAFR